jgi:curved DNA-binding protein CbpA
MSLYDILGVKKDVKPEDVKRAYRRKARDTHPDKGGSKEDFFRVNHAYQVLSDPARREAYDTRGEDVELGDQRAKMMEEMASLVFAIIEGNQDDVAHINILEVAVSTVKKAIDLQRREVDKNQLAAEKLRKAVKRFSAKNGDRDSPLYWMLEHRVKQYEVGRLNAEAAIARNEIMLELLAEYDYKVDARPPGQMTWADVLAQRAQPTNANMQPQRW